MESCKVAPWIPLFGIIESAQFMSPKKLLIIDDCVEDRQTLRRFLATDQVQAYEIEESDSAQEGYERCQQSLYDLVFLDWRLPDEDGLDVLKKLTQINPQPPVIMISAFGNEELAVKAIKSGAKDYLPKQTLTAQRLQESLETSLEQEAVSLQADVHRTDALLARTALRIRETLNLDSIIHTAVQEVRDLFKCDRVLLCQFDAEMQTQVVSESVSEEWPSILGQSFQEEYFQREGREHYCSGRRQITNNVDEAELSDCHRALLHELRVKSTLVLPIIIHSQSTPQPKLWGIMVAHHCAAVRNWQPEEVQLFEELAIQLSIAIQQAELLAVTQTSLQQEKKLNSLKSQFIATVSHEYRSPLATILAASSTLKRCQQKLSETKQSQFLNMIENKARYMTQLVDDLLAVHQFETDQVTFDPKWINLETLISQILDNFQRTTDSRCELVLDIQGNFQEFLGDQGLLHLILNNLISNALKYSPAGGLVTVQLQPQGYYLAITIADQGIGIPSADLLEMFEPFRRGSNIDVLPGTGLGLAIVKMCVHLHQGNVTLRSVENEGTSVIVRLPNPASDGI
jgi:signal transduction histidine kinase/CheY-like chemotaxis protein